MDWVTDQRLVARNERAEIARDERLGRYAAPVEAFRVRDAMGRESWQERPATAAELELAGQGRLFDPDLDT